MVVTTMGVGGGIGEASPALAPASAERCAWGLKLVEQTIDIYVYALLCFFKKYATQNPLHMYLYIYIHTYRHVCLYI